MRLIPAFCNTTLAFWIALLVPSAIMAQSFDMFRLHIEPNAGIEIFMTGQKSEWCKVEMQLNFITHKRETLEDIDGINGVVTPMIEKLAASCPKLQSVKIIGRYFLSPDYTFSSSFNKQSSGSFIQQPLAQSGEPGLVVDEDEEEAQTAPVKSTEPVIEQTTNGQRAPVHPESFNACVEAEAGRRDYKRTAIKLCREAIANDPENAELWAYLASSLLFHSPRPKDHTEAREWAQKSAVTGNPIAQTVMGSLSRDPIAAYTWYQLGAAQGNKYAKRHLPLAKRQVESMKRRAKSAHDRQAAADALVKAERAEAEALVISAREAQATIEALVKAEQQRVPAAHHHTFNECYNEAGPGRAVYDNSSKRGMRLIHGMNAVSACTKAIEADEDNAELWAYMARALIRNRKYDKARQWAQKSADAGFSLGYATLGHIHYYGSGTARDDEEALRWLRFPAEQGIASAQYNLGVMYYHDGDYDKAGRWFLLAALQDVGDAQNTLTSMARSGDFDPQKNSLSAGQNKNTAQNLFDHCFEGAARQVSEITWPYYRIFQCQSAIEADPENLELQAMLARAYHQNEQYSEALQWVQPAAKQGNTTALVLLAKMHFYGKGVQESREESAKWLLIAARNGDISSQLEMGERYTYGWGVSKSAKNALIWYQMAADQGSERGKSRAAETVRSIAQGKARAKRENERKAQLLKSEDAQRARISLTFCSHANSSEAEGACKYALSSELYSDDQATLTKISSRLEFFTSIEGQDARKAEQQKLDVAFGTQKNPYDPIISNRMRLFYTQDFEELSNEFKRQFSLFGAHSPAANFILRYVITHSVLCGPTGPSSTIAFTRSEKTRQDIYTWGPMFGAQLGQPRVMSGGQSWEIEVPERWADLTIALSSHSLYAVSEPDARMLKSINRVGGCDHGAQMFQALDEGMYQFFYESGEIDYE